MEKELIKEYKRFFKEMAFSKDQIWLRLGSTDINRLEHMLLIYLLPNDNSINHWQVEVAANILQVARMRYKKTNKFLTQNEYMNFYWNEPFEDKNNYKIIDDTIKDLIYEGYSIPSDWKNVKSNIVISMKEFYSHVSKDISEGNITKEKIYELIKKYKTR